MIAEYLRNRWADEQLPKDYTVAMRKIQEMRYGENPHQKGAFYETVPASKEPCVANTKQLQGKELSYNNILDTDSAFETVKEYDETAVVNHKTQQSMRRGHRLE
jgi:phosphoribosylaminoimidazolecarboxamide formyltransferase/IMP cyclohydrolase